MNIEEAKERLALGMERGVTCPCCDQFVKLYRRKLSSGMARALICIYHDAVDDQWLDVTACLMRRRLSAANTNAALLRYWELLEQMPGERADGSRRVGFYKITSVGREFVTGVMTVPRYIYLYNNTLIERDCDERITIQDALGDRFNYAELMAS